MNDLREVTGLLASARNLAEILAAAHAALDAMLAVIDERQDRADGAYAAFVMAGTSVASSRLALWSAPSLPGPPAALTGAGDPVRACAAGADDVSALAGLAGLLARRLEAAAASADDAGDRAACADAARHARAACSSLGGSPP